MMITDQIKSLFKHSSIYGIGTIIGQAVGFLLLPLYTRYLTPADYGIATILEITLGFVGVIVGWGIFDAMNRFYQDYDDEATRNHVVSTLYWIIAVVSIIVLVVTEWASTFLSQILFDNDAYASLFNLVAIGMALGFFISPGMWYCMVKNRSFLYVTISLLNLIAMIGFNIWFIAFMELGIKGIYYSMIITRVIFAVALSLPILWSVGISFSRQLAVGMLQFSLPMIFSSLFRMGTNESDKYFINYFLSPVETGIYTVANKFGNAIHVLISVPFMQSFLPKRFEIMKQADARETYAQIFNYYMLLVGSVGFIISVLSPEIIHIMATEKFYKAADYIPLIVISWIVLGMRHHFETGILIEKKTKYFAYINGSTGVLTIALNYLLIGKYNMWGALVALNISQLTTTGLFYFISQKLYPIQFHLKFIMKLIVISISFFIVANLVKHDNMLISLTIKGMIIVLYFFSLRLGGLIDDSFIAMGKDGYRRITTSLRLGRSHAR